MEIDIKEYIAPLRKWWWLIAITTIVAGASSYFATRQQVPVYRSTTTLLIGSAYDELNPSNTELTLTRQLTTFYVDLANRSEVRNATMEALDLNGLPQISVHQVNDNFIEITVTDTVPQRAQAVADELARQLVQRTPAAKEDDVFVNDLLDSYEVQIKETEDEIGAKQVAIGEAVSALEIAELQEDLASLESTRQTLTTSYANLRSSAQRGAANTISVLEPAPLPRNPVVPNNMITILTAAAIGFVLSSAAAYTLEYMDDSVKTPDAVSRLTNLSTLAGIAKVNMEESKLVTVSKPRAPTSEAFRVLRTAIQFASEDSDSRILLVTSGVPFEGKSTIASNLAVVIAQAGYSVVLVDADLRRPTQHQVFDLPNKRGLTTLLLETGMMEADEDERQKLVSETAQVTRVNGLLVLASGPIPPNPSELLGSTKMESLLETLAAQFDFVILDSPPVLSVTDAAILSTKADSCLLVIKADKSRKEHLRQVVARLRDMNANLVGCVLNALTPKSEGYKFYYYYQDPYYSYDDEDEADATGGGPTARLRRRFLRGQAA